MMHIENVSHVLQYGITHSSSTNANAKYVSMGDSSLISSRSQFVMPNGKRLGSYIPFYFGVRVPMLYVIQKGFNMVKSVLPEEIIYCVSTVQHIIDHNLSFVFSDGHAMDGFTSFFGIEDVANIGSIIDLAAIKSKYWKVENDNDLKRRKEAEFLVDADIPPEAIVFWVVYNETAKSKLLTSGITEKQIFVKPDYYF